VAVEQATDEMLVSGFAASAADGKLAGEMRLCSGRERSRLLVPAMLTCYLRVFGKQSSEMASSCC